MATMMMATKMMITTMMGGGSDRTVLVNIYWMQLDCPSTIATVIKRQLKFFNSEFQQGNSRELGNERWLHGVPTEDAPQPNA